MQHALIIAIVLLVVSTTGLLVMLSYCRELKDNLALEKDRRQSWRAQCATLNNKLRESQRDLIIAKRENKLLEDSLHQLRKWMLECPSTYPQ